MEDQNRVYVTKISLTKQLTTMNINVQSSMKRVADIPDQFSSSKKMKLSNNKSTIDKNKSSKDNKSTMVNSVNQIELPPAIKAINEGLQRPPQVNPKIQQGKKLLVLQAKISSSPQITGEIAGEILEISVEESWTENKYSDPMACKASTDPDVMYMHEAIRQKDSAKFLEAMQKEVDDQMANGNFTIVRKFKVPKDKIILPAVWQMRQKRDIKTRQIKKYQARLSTAQE